MLHINIEVPLLNFKRLKEDQFLVENFILLLVAKVEQELFKSIKVLVPGKGGERICHAVKTEVQLFDRLAPMLHGFRHAVDTESMEHFYQVCPALTPKDIYTVYEECIMWGGSAIDNW